MTPIQPVTTGFPPSQGTSESARLVVPARCWVVTGTQLLARRVSFRIEPRRQPPPQVSSRDVSHSATSGYWATSSTNCCPLATLRREQPPPLDAPPAVQPPVMAEGSLPRTREEPQRQPPPRWTLGIRRRQNKGRVDPQEQPRPRRADAVAPQAQFLGRDVQRVVRAAVALQFATGPRLPATLRRSRGHSPGCTRTALFPGSPARYPPGRAPRSPGFPETRPRHRTGPL